MTVFSTAHTNLTWNLFLVLQLVLYCDHTPTRTIVNWRTGSTGWKREMRSFFESVAGLLSFDTKQADNWYANFQAVNSIAMRDKVKCKTNNGK